ncbi:alpha/beta hydrolase fold domain-containing protein [Parasphingorhabdus sp.]|uniref:alpha/beta hydrolase fold domain-containing protein n=1 Tax=Parasphingorhabdus sp. TaxID=2709688 RepID=UPI003A9547C5
MDASIPGYPANAGSDIDLRLVQLEAKKIAHAIQSQMVPLAKTFSDFGARIENRIIQAFLIRSLRPAIDKGADPVERARLLSAYRTAAARGTFAIFNPVMQPPPDAQLLFDPASPLAADYADADWTEESADEPILFYVPGGGFILPPSPKQVGLAFRLAEHCGCEAVIGKHRLAPEYPFPQPARDLADQYEAILKSGKSPERIILSGDSAGATLILAMMLELRERRLPMPGGAILFSPWGDLAMRGWSYISKSMSGSSPFRMETAAFSAKLYLGDALPTDPRASPVYADLREFPPLAIHCSRHDMHFDDAVQLTEKANDANVPVTMNYWDSPRHHLERFGSKDANKSFDLVAEFINARFKRAA